MVQVIFNQRVDAIFQPVLEAVKRVKLARVVKAEKLAMQGMPVLVVLVAVLTVDQNAVLTLMVFSSVHLFINRVVRLVIQVTVVVQAAQRVPAVLVQEAHAVEQAAYSSSELSRPTTPNSKITLMPVKVLAIELQGLSQSYRTRGETRVIYDNVNFTAKSGEVTLIMGSSGSGKTTLLRQIALLDRNSQGEIYYFGESVAHKNLAKKAKIRSKQLGFIFQSYALIEEFSVLENCALPLLMNGYKKTAAMAKAREYIHNFIADIAVNKQPNELSGGEQQRVAVIRALIHQPGIIIADEPTGNLDSHNANLIKKELVRIATQLGSAVIIVSHDDNFIECSDAFYRLEPCVDPQVKSQLVKVK